MNGRGTGSAPYVKTALSTTVTLVKAGKVSLAGFFQYNPSNAAAYVQFFDVSSAGDVTLGTTVPTFVIGAATGSFSQGQFCKPIQFTNGMAIAATTTPTGSSAPSAANVVGLALGD